jgi:chromosome segregation ATPase
MKKVMLITVLSLLIGSMLTSCNRGKVNELEQKNGELTQINSLQDSLLNDFMMYFNEFEDNLEMIRERESIISMSAEDPEYQGDRKEKILEDIQLINSLLVQNHSIIDSLSQRLEGSEGRVREFRRTIARLNQRLSEKTDEVNSLKTRLEKMDFTLASLNSKIDTLTRVSSNLRERSEQQITRIEAQENQLEAQSQRIAYQTKSLNTAFYITGTSKELRERRVLEKEGGLLGIGGAKQLADDFDPKVFTSIDVTQVNEIPLNGKKVDLLTTHPSDSYVLHSKDDSKQLNHLEITNPDKFWSASKYLVVVVN